jgi:alkylhydroperoxidase family enzyme
VAHIPYVADDEAKGLLSELYDDHRNEHGVVDNILRIHSLNPRSLKDHSRLYFHLMRGRSPLSRTQREMLAVTVSAENDCFY